MKNMNRNVNNGANFVLNNDAFVNGENNLAQNIRAKNAAAVHITG